MNDDERMKKTFDKLREDDARRAPSFEALRRRAPRTRTAWAVVVPLASAMAAAAVFVVWCNVAREAAPASVAVAPPAMLAPQAALAGEVAAAPRVDEAPLDFLLDVPGLRGAPNFDTSLLRGSLR